MTGERFEAQDVDPQFADLLWPVFKGGSPTPRIQASAHHMVHEALDQHGGPSDRALIDILWAYIHAPEGGRDALFLAVACQALSCPKQQSAPSTPEGR